MIKDYDNAGYGVITENEKKAMRELAQTEGIILDPVYSSHAYYGMIDHLVNNKIEKGSNILFWHTVGLPAIFCYSKELT
ncbi:pyridoxal-phosphate dependent enzyme [Bizionia saleffrena]|uniref:Pyridoxal-phosphate dependent enzyme n=1 Tax=Bizionia saleffrena TaxID=291189 RepID=A0A8H2LKM3_9FLAO|nr:pyridoxal-phosphate dependent enzyme [Bizionia saleffrena]